ncbi:hypothetical protein ACFQ1L_46370 [Phytohabitans flavus]|uniref:hypothetical protein n=1 Tax=Phytohabitans flavus TaxID=1076124 RepID=UPI0036300E0F
MARRPALRGLAARIGLSGLPADGLARLDVAFGAATRSPDGARTVLTGFPVPAPGPPDPQGYPDESLVRSALLDAHAVVVAVDYTDLVADATTAGDYAAVAAWLPLAVDVVGPDRVAVCIDGWHQRRTAPENRRDWGRQRARRLLGMPAVLPVDAIVEVDTGLALARHADERLGALRERLLGPFRTDPRGAFAAATLRRLHRTARAIGRRCDDLLGVLPDGAAVAPVAPDSVTGPAYAAQRRAWLVGRGVGPLAARVAAATAPSTRSTSTVDDSGGTSGDRLPYGGASQGGRVVDEDAAVAGHDRAHPA